MTQPGSGNRFSDSCTPGRDRADFWAGFIYAKISTVSGRVPGTIVRFWEQATTTGDAKKKARRKDKMGCSHWKTVKFKVVSCRSGITDRGWPVEHRNNNTDHRPPPSAEQLLLLQRIGQLKLDHRPGPNAGRLGALFQSVIL
uniref:Uncharacterized protein n=1 Tax=Anopheles farauti TaxID=69004 RepID=A0A182QS98_9DIPT